ncbi:MAG: hypothetical protein AAFU41_04740 [Pseudomonadota bacterium]
MRAIVFLAAVGTTCLLGLGAAIAQAAPETEVCVARAPEQSASGVGYELIDVARRQAWVTIDWTPDAYAAFRPGILAPHWIKSDPRQGVAAMTRALQSPDCANAGEFTYKTLFGKRFFHIADITSIRGEGLTGGALVEGEVFKHHMLQFSTGQTASFLVSPEGDHFVLVNRPLDMAAVENTLPVGWRLDDVALSAPWQADLVGSVKVLRLADGSSFQGPVTS